MTPTSDPSATVDITATEIAALNDILHVYRYHRRGEVTSRHVLYVVARRWLNRAVAALPVSPERA